MDYLAAMRAFVRSVELGSFSKAAADAGIKVSTISRYVSALEADLGAALLNRSTRRIHLTEIGAMFLERATDVLDRVETARAEATAFNARPQGLLRVVVPLGFGPRHVAPHVPEYQAMHPEVRIELTALDGAVDLIALGFDVGIRLGTLEDSTLVAKRLGTERWELVASARVRGVRAPADLATQACLPLVRHVTEGWNLVRGTERARVRVDGRYRTSDPESLLAPTLAGAGIALLPTWLTAADRAAGRLVRVLPAWSGAELGIWGVYPPKKTVSPKVRTFLAFMSPRLREA